RTRLVSVAAADDPAECASRGRGGPSPASTGLPERIGKPREPPPPASRSAGEPAPDELVHGPAVDVLPREAGHDRFHDAADVLRRAGASFGDGLLDSRL